MPYGLLSSGILMWRKDGRNNFHRKVLFSQRGRLPWMIWLLSQWFLAVRWRWFFAAQATDNALSRYGAVIAAQEGLSIEDQRRSILKLSKRYCIHPQSIYRFRLYRDPKTALNFVFPREVKPLHRLRNTKCGEDDKSVMQDKFKFSQRCTSAGLPSVPTMQSLKKGKSIASAEIRFGGHSGVFLKSRSGFRGLGAFSIEKRQDQLIGHMHHDGRTIRTDEEIQTALDDLLRNDDVLVQPCLSNDQLLSSVAPPNQTVVLRVVTIGSSIQPLIYSAYLRIPLFVESSAYHPEYSYEVLAGVNVMSGEICKNVDSSLSLNPYAGAYEERVLKELGKAPVVKFWNEIAHYSIEAQKEFSGLWAVGWDWFVTEKRPYLLEGNVDWEAQKPQEISGGLVEWLANRAPSHD